MRKSTEIVILIFLIASVTYSLISLFTSPVVVSFQFYSGVAGLTIAAVTRIWNQKLSGLILTGILAIGVINIVEFSHYTFTFSLDIIPFLKINPLVLLFFLAELAINGQTIREFLSDNPDAGQEANSKQMEIKGFSKRYENLTDKELHAIINKPNDYVESARVAAKDILDKRKNGL
ncbi:hypothetical protein [Carboxylicivirga linearis]|uniref:Uncharacterized protein n=1 Tax=Carboxylicivirga linearis TaxID=1628157 RepID=A0ABS5K266_9BACT|nr:hypothetical protein [Carboxylicivirga linearis]MBS2101233.1 hypothetical protein [Carboxylicivirga linearis]